MKDLTRAHKKEYRRVHFIGELLGNIRHWDSELEGFRISIQPEIYPAYAGDEEYGPRTLPELTSFPDYQEKTTAAA